MVPERDFRKKVETAILSVGRDDVLHMGRYVLILDMIRRIASPDMKVLDVASSGQILPALRQVIGLSDIRVTNGGPDCRTTIDQMLRLPPTKDGLIFSCPYDIFDIEKPFPYPDETFDLVIFTEVLEHITRDPMHTVSEINRITKVGGWLVLETPNCTSLRSVIRSLRGIHPQHWSQYFTNGIRDRHNREYTPQEAAKVVESAGYQVNEILTANNSYVMVPASRGKRIGKWMVNQALALISFALGNYVSPKMRGEATFITARKRSAVRTRFPEFLYAPFDPQTFDNGAN